MTTAILVPPHKAAYMRRYNALHREENHAYAAVYRDSHKEERRVYKAAYDQAHREERRTSRIAYRDANKTAILEGLAEQRAAFTEWLSILRDVTGCEDEGLHGGHLEHHHRDPATKLYNISDMHRSSQEKLCAELAKCVVLCMAHHKQRHVSMRLSARSTA